MDGRANCLPLLRWAGSKKRQFSAISRIFPRHYKNYVEPFAGSAAFAFCLGEREARLNDLNSDLVAFYRDVSKNSSDFYDDFTSIPRTKEAYYEVRKKYNAEGNSEKKSVLFYYLNRNCFNGIFRINKVGEFNVPFSNYKVSPYLSKDQFLKSVNLISSASIENLDFEEFCKSKVYRGDFVFIDPPYYSEDRIFNEYNQKPFTLDDVDRLRSVLEHIEDVGARFILSYPLSALSRSLERGWRSVRMPVLRTIAGNSLKRTIVQELLIYNYDRRST